MTDQKRAVFTKEYKANNGVLIIDNMFNPNKSKTDIIKEIIENTTCLDNWYNEQMACRDAVYSDSSKKTITRKKRQATRLSTVLP